MWCRQAGRRARRGCVWLCGCWGLAAGGGCMRAGLALGPAACCPGQQPAGEVCGVAGAGLRPAGLVLPLTVSQQLAWDRWAPLHAAYCVVYRVCSGCWLCCVQELRCCLAGGVVTAGRVRYSVWWLGARGWARVVAGGSRLHCLWARLLGGRPKAHVCGLSGGVGAEVLYSGTAPWLLMRRRLMQLM
jgi:hypothetical protein